MVEEDQKNEKKNEIKRSSLKKASTLPRGFGGVTAVTLSEMNEGGGEDTEMMGLCGELLRHCGEEGGAGGETMRRSDPTLSSMTSTLDRRLMLRAGRPRSLDLSSASIDSKASAATASTSSEEHHPRHSTATIQEITIPETDCLAKSEETILESSNSHPRNEDEFKNTENSHPRNEDEFKNTENSHPRNEDEFKNTESSFLQEESSTHEDIPVNSIDRKQKRSQSCEPSTKSAEVDDLLNHDQRMVMNQPNHDQKITPTPLRSSHKRSNSDVTYKSLSSSMNNITCYGTDDILLRKETDEGDPKNPTKANSKSEVKDVKSRTSKVPDKGLSRSPTGRTSSGKNNMGKEEDLPRTVLVLTGGQGYKCLREDTPNNGPPHNNTDAHILVWEMKL